MEFHRYPIGPILEHFGFDPIDMSRGRHAVRCHFHGDRDASGSVDPDSGWYNCFVCDVRGSGSQILMKMEGLSFRDAERRAEEITGDRNISVRGGPGRGSSVAGEAWDNRSYRAFKASWSSQESD